MSRLTVAPLAEFDRSGGRVMITAPFGDGRGHQGVDWGTTDGIEVGTVLHAPVDGHVENTGDDGPYTPSGGHTAGRWLWFRGADGTRWKMFHLNRVTIGVGQLVAAGTAIAEVGNTGTQAAHLHLEEHAGSWSAPVDFTGDAYEVINAGRWPGTGPAGEDDDMTEADFQRIADMINHAIANFGSSHRLFIGDGAQFEVVVGGDGRRYRRNMTNGDEISALKKGAEIADMFDINVRDLTPGEQDALQRFPWVTQ
jgi:hypothetical protein